MIIWGSKSKEKEVGAGQFHCPNCEEQSSYIHKKVGRYFTLYFIPLFQTQELGEFVECQRCHQAYKPNVLQYEPPSQVERLLFAVRADLEDGTPVQMACRKLINKGMDEATAGDLVWAACGDSHLICPACNLYYRSGVTKCSTCGTATVPASGGDGRELDLGG